LSFQTTEFENGINITISGGISEFNNNSAEDMIHRADKNLYRAKVNGKNRFEI